MRKKLVIQGEEILPGENRRIVVNISRLPSHSSIDIIVNVSRSGEEGPVLLLMGGLHGDEINGVEIVRRILERNLNRPDAGTVICIPIINIYGFINFSRYVPDGKDVNRSFPGNKNGSLASRVAYYLRTDILPKIDYGIDFHTGGADRFNYPQIRTFLKEEGNSELAEAFCAPVTLHAVYRPKSLRQLAARMGKKMLVYEAGESARFDEFAIEEGIRGTLRLMKYLGMIHSDHIPVATHKNLVIQKATWIRASRSGLFQPMVSCGQIVRKNQAIGHITDTFGEFKILIKSPGNGIIIGLNHNPILHLGDAIAHLGHIPETKKDRDRDPS